MAPSPVSAAITLIQVAITPRTIHYPGIVSLPSPLPHSSVSTNKQRYPIKI